jgi:hypothetical protein
MKLMLPKPHYLRQIYTHTHIQGALVDVDTCVCLGGVLSGGVGKPHLGLVFGQSPVRWVWATALTNNRVHWVGEQWGRTRIRHSDSSRSPRLRTRRDTRAISAWKRVRKQCPSQSMSVSTSAPALPSFLVSSYHPYGGQVLGRGRCGRWLRAPASRRDAC